VSNRRPYSAAAMPVATDAFMILAPSRCSFKSSSRAVVTTSSISFIRQQRPPDELCVCSTATSRVRAMCIDVRSRMSARTSSPL
jgi:hypothetical protein